MNVGHRVTSKEPNAATLRPDDSLQSAARLLGSRRTGLAVVIDDSSQTLGVVSAMDSMRAVGEHGEDAAAMPVKEAMTSEVAVCCPQDSVQHALEQMVARRIRHLPVVDDGVFKGVIRLRDAVELRRLRSKRTSFAGTSMGRGITDRQARLTAFCRRTGRPLRSARRDELTDGLAPKQAADRRSAGKDSTIALKARRVAGSSFAGIGTLPRAPSICSRVACVEHTALTRLKVARFKRCQVRSVWIQ
jgi:CBS domain-containing protein